MRVLVDGKPLRRSMRGVKTVAGLLSAIGMSSETAIVKVNGRIVTELDSVGPSDRVEVIRVSTGG
ncbi:MAG: MoaD/ThiS family protein [Candidatus Micrarchaeota archaeon]|nr:MoaD/ThiS family protein [Candidatus Micrarchaeota archaeon]